MLDLSVASAKYVGLYFGLEPEFPSPKNHGMSSEQPQRWQSGLFTSRRQKSDRL